MRKRRCFADTELDAVMLERERSHALSTRRAAAVVPQQPVLFRLPITPYQLPPPELACRRPDTAALRLIGLVRSWWTPQSGLSIPAASSGCRSVAEGQPSKSSVDVGGTFSEPQQLEVGGLPLAYTGSRPTLGVMPTAPAVVRTTTTTRDDQQSPTSAVVIRPEVLPSSWTNASSGRRHSLMTRTHGDSDKEHRHVKSKSLRTTKTFDFSVESLLAK